MPLPGKGLLRHLPAKPPLSPKHREEQIKFVANALQSLGFAVLVGVLIGPTLNPALIASFLLRAGALVFIGMAWLLGFLLLRYIPPPPAP